MLTVLIPISIQRQLTSSQTNPRSPAADCSTTPPPPPNAQETLRTVRLRRCSKSIVQQPRWPSAALSGAGGGGGGGEALDQEACPSPPLRRLLDFERGDLSERFEEEEEEEAINQRLV